MKRMKTVGVKELKNNLSAYLREVRNGATVLVSDRSNIVAELHLAYGQDQTSGLHPLLIEWANAGILSLPTTGKLPLPPSPIQLREGTAMELLNSDREESRA
jgi:hypothetical protein